MVTENGNTFQVFLELVNFDQDIRQDRLRLSALYSDIGDLEKKESILLKDLDSAKENVTTAQKAVDEVELDVKTLDEQERSKREQLDQLSNYKEYQSVQKELDNIHNRQQQQEKLVITAWDQLEAYKKIYARKQQEYAEENESIQKELNEKRQSAQQLEDAIAQKVEGRPSKEQGVPEEWLDNYTRMREQIEDPVVPIVQGSCGVCFYKVTGQEGIRARQGALIQCKSCYRLLYEQQNMDNKKSEGQDT